RPAPAHLDRRVAAVRRPDAALLLVLPQLRLRQARRGVPRDHPAGRRTGSPHGREPAAGRAAAGPQRGAAPPRPGRGDARLPPPAGGIGPPPRDHVNGENALDQALRALASWGCAVSRATSRKRATSGDWLPGTSSAATSRRNRMP